METTHNRSLPYPLESNQIHSSKQIGFRTEILSGSGRMRDGEGRGGDSKDVKRKEEEQAKEDEEENY